MKILSKLIPALMLLGGLFAFTNTQAQNVNVFNGTNCKFVMEIVYQATGGPNCNDIGATTVISYPNTVLNVPLPLGATMYKAGATESQSWQGCAVYSPTCDPQQNCGLFGVCGTTFVWGSNTLLGLF